MRRRALAATAAALLLGAGARAETAVRLGEGLTLQPYVLGQWDAASFRNGAEGGQAAGTNLRRARLGGRLDVADAVRLGLVWDFGHLPGGSGSLFEAMASLTAWAPLRASAGVFKTNFSLESMQDAGSYLMGERASIVTLTRNLAAGIRREGVELGADGERYNVSVAATAGRAGPGRDGGQRAVVARAVGLPVHTDGLTVHAGLSGEWVLRPARGTVALSEQPELQVDDVPPSLDTGPIHARRAAAVGPELGLGWRRLWLQGEYYAVLVDPAGAATGGSLRFDGWYAQAAWTVLGRPRAWRHASGSWGPPTPAEPFNPAAGQWGALELGARVSAVDLDSGSVRGGRQHVVSVVANWWPVEPLRFSALLEHGAVRGGSAPRTLDAVAVRGQVRF